MHHYHICRCGGSEESHDAGSVGCLRMIVAAPLLQPDGSWTVDGVTDITDFTLRQQWGYHLYPCGCWSRNGAGDLDEFKHYA